MFSKIINHEELSKILSDSCKENNIEANISNYLINKYQKAYLVLKTDKYYNSLSFKNDEKTPPSTDCLILVKCNKQNCYDLYLIELKNINKPKRFEVENIKDKFKTVIDDFMESRFKDIFNNEKYCKFNCYFITNPYGFKGTQEEYDKKIKTKGLKLDSFNSMKPLVFNKKVTMIKSILPNPIIESC